MREFPRVVEVNLGAIVAGELGQRRSQPRRLMGAHTAGVRNAHELPLHPRTVSRGRSREYQGAGRQADICEYHPHARKPTTPTPALDEEQHARTHRLVSKGRGLVADPLTADRHGIELAIDVGNIVATRPAVDDRVTAIVLSMDRVVTALTSEHIRA